MSQNLLMLVRILKDEDKNENNIRRKREQLDGSRMTIPAEVLPNYLTTHGAMGENLEFFIENHIIETLASFAIIDQPQGFFKFLLGAIDDLI